MESIDFSQEIIGTINKRRDSGMSLNQALEGTGISRDAYYAAMRNPDGQKRTMDRIQRIKYVDHCYTRQGMSSSEIAEFLGVSRSQVNKYLKEIGVERQPKIRKRKVSPERAAAEAKERNMLDRLINKEGRTMAEISKETGLSVSVLKTRIKRYGIVRGENAVKKKQSGDEIDNHPLRQIVVQKWKPIKMEQRQWFTL